MADKFGYPAPDWPRYAIVGIHNEMDEIRKHANEKCRTILAPALPFGQDVFGARNWDPYRHSKMISRNGDEKQPPKTEHVPNQLQ